jgi:Uma2 family endonuclease
MPTLADETIRRHTFTVADYYRMADTGILGPEARVELVDGEIIDMPPIGSRHAATIDHLTKILREQVRDLALVRAQHPVSLSGRSEPVPDIALVRPRADFYKSAHPSAADVLLIIEVAETTLRYDRQIKTPLYARHGIAEYWIADLEGRRLLRHRDPHEVTYALVDEPDLAEPIAPGAMPGLRLNLAPVFAD